MVDPEGNFWMVPNLKLTRCICYGQTPITSSLIARPPSFSINIEKLGGSGDEANHMALINFSYISFLKNLIPIP